MLFPSVSKQFSIIIAAICLTINFSKPVRSETPETPDLDINPEIIESSPVLQRWLQEIPDLEAEIKHDPSFTTRWRFGYSFFSTDNESGFKLGVEDLFVGNTPVTVSASYQSNFDGDRQTWGADLHYYLLPLGSYVNISPVVGYRNVEIDNYETDGVNVGLRLILPLSRSGAADVSLTQTFVSPGGDDEVGTTSVSLGYAVTPNLRISSDVERQNTREDNETRISILLEWISKP